MATSDIKRFQELLTSDAEFQEKFRKAAEGFTGSTDEKTVFEQLLLPLGKEYGLSATYEEFRKYTDALKKRIGDELSEDELSQIAGGKNDGYGFCAVIGGGDMFGVKASDNFSFYACEVIGIATFCPGVGGD